MSIVEKQDKAIQRQKVSNLVQLYSASKLANIDGAAQSIDKKMTYACHKLDEIIGGQRLNNLISAHILEESVKQNEQLGSLNECLKEMHDMQAQQFETLRRERAIKEALYSLDKFMRFFEEQGDVISQMYAAEKLLEIIDKNKFTTADIESFEDKKVFDKTKDEAVALIRKGGREESERLANFKKLYATLVELQDNPFDAKEPEPEKDLNQLWVESGFSKPVVNGVELAKNNYQELLLKKSERSNLEKELDDFNTLHSPSKDNLITAIGLAFIFLFPCVVGMVVTSIVSFEDDTTADAFAVIAWSVAFVGGMGMCVRGRWYSGTRRELKKKIDKIDDLLKSKGFDSWNDFEKSLDQFTEYYKQKKAFKEKGVELLRKEKERYASEIREYQGQSTDYAKTLSSIKSILKSFVNQCHGLNKFIDASRFETSS